MTFILPSPDKQFLTVGYADGTIRVFELSTTDLVATFSGHRSAITCLAYDQSGHRLASGSKVSIIFTILLCKCAHESFSWYFMCVVFPNLTILFICHCFRTRK